MPPKGSKKKPATVTFTEAELQIVMSRLGYKKQQDLMDDLAMGEIAPLAAPGAPMEKLPMEKLPMEKLPTDHGKTIVDPAEEKRKSWAEEVEAAEAVGNPKDQQNAPIENQMTKPWAEIVRGNRISGNGLDLEYIPAGEEVIITEEDWEEGGKQWRFPAVAKVIDSKPPYAEMVKWATVNWRLNAPRVSQLKPGVFLFDFATSALREDALSKNWTFFAKYTVVFKPWNIDKQVDERDFDSTPVWIQLPGLPPRCWTPRNLSRIVSFIGTPLVTDRMTAEKTKYAYARVKVDVKSLDDLPDEIPVKRPNGTSFQQKVLYEWRMKKCTGCGLLGHEEINCRRRRKEEAPVAKTDIPAPVETTQEITVVDKPVTSITITQGGKAPKEGLPKETLAKTPGKGVAQSQQIQKGRGNGDNASSSQTQGEFTVVTRKGSGSKAKSTGGLQIRDTNPKPNG